jgi:hypothetical protein
MKLAGSTGKSIGLIWVGAFIFWFMPDLLHTPEIKNLPDGVSPSDLLFLRVWLVLFMAALVFVLIVEEQNHNQLTIESEKVAKISDQIRADFAAHDAIICELETEAETLKREIKIFHEIIETTTMERTGRLSETKSISNKFDWDIAHAYINKAVRDGYTDDDGFEEYLETLGIRRLEKSNDLMGRIREKNCKLTERIKMNLEQIREISRSAGKKYSRV